MIVSPLAFMLVISALTNKHLHALLFHLVFILVLPGKVLCALTGLSEVEEDSSDEKRFIVDILWQLFSVWGSLESKVMTEEGVPQCQLTAQCQRVQVQVQGWEEKATNHFGGRNVI